MSERSSVSGSDDDDENDKKLAFVLLLKDHPVLLEKSQVPNVKKAKKKALASLRSTLEQNTAQEISDGQLTKKIHNFKAQVKRKTDAKQTGNKRIALKTWEKEFMKLMKSDTNPTFAKVPGEQTLL
jgi:hypothetical protein